MSTDKRTVHTDALETLGMIITDKEKRDAIHLAVEPVIAVDYLNPGDHVGFKDDGVGICDNPVGIVDPFLKGIVAKGERFWLVVYPRQITSLRHVWQHPAFPKSSVEPILGKTVNPSEEWIRNYADEIGIDYDELMDGAKNYLTNNDYVCDGGRWEGFSIDRDFWTHYAAITGDTLPSGKYHNFFTCSC